MGAKSYGYVRRYPEFDRKTDPDKLGYPEIPDGKPLIKLKGITLDERNFKKFNYEALKSTALENKTLESEDRHLIGRRFLF